MTSPTSLAAAGNRLILAVSFSGPGGSLALADGRDIDEIFWTERATASELATVRLMELLARGGRTLPDLTHVLVNNGPGSFTGIRVGLNLARALAYALPRPIAAIDALTILAHKHLRPGDRRLIALKAVRNHHYVAEYARDHDRLILVDGPRSLPREDARFDSTDVLIEGETAGFDPHPRASDLARAYLDQPELAIFSSDSVKPLYVRGSEAEEKSRK